MDRVAADGSFAHSIASWRDSIATRPWRRCRPAEGRGVVGCDRGEWIRLRPSPARASVAEDLRAQEVAGEVDREQRVPLRERQVGERPAAASGIVHEHVAGPNAAAVASAPQQCSPGSRRRTAPSRRCRRPRGSGAPPSRPRGSARFEAGDPATGGAERPAHARPMPAGPRDDRSPSFESSQLMDSLRVGAGQSENLFESGG